MFFKFLVFYTIKISGNFSCKKLRRPRSAKNDDIAEYSLGRLQIVGIYTTSKLTRSSPPAKKTLIAIKTSAVSHKLQQIRE